MSRTDLLKHIAYEYRGCFDINVDRVETVEGELVFYSACSWAGYFLDLDRLELVSLETPKCRTQNLEGLLLQVDLYLNKKGIGDLYK